MIAAPAHDQTSVTVNNLALLIVSVGVVNENNMVTL